MKIIEERIAKLEERTAKDSAELRELLDALELWRDREYDREYMITFIKKVSKESTDIGLEAYELFEDLEIIPFKKKRPEQP